MPQFPSSRLITLALLAVVIAAMPAQGQNFSVLYMFHGGDGLEPYSNLLDVGGTFFGTTFEGGTYSVGTIFKLDGKGKETVIYSFTGLTDGGYPNSALVSDKMGNLYGTTRAGGDYQNCQIYINGCGVVYELSAAGTLSVLYTFTGGADGAAPQGVILDPAENLVGTTFWGGLSLTCCGVVFRLDRSGHETPLYTFSGGTDGGIPNGPLIADSSGNLYGTTSNGGNLSCLYFNYSGCGVVFKLNVSGNESVLYAFTGGADGAGANGGLLLDSAGNLFGTAFYGGDPNCRGRLFYGCGVIFEVTQSGIERVLHTFTGPDGSNPSSGLVRDVADNLFGTTANGGTFDFGTVFELNSRTGEIVLHDFSRTDGSSPLAGLTWDRHGNLYGTTSMGGLSLPSCPPLGCGTVFRVVSPPPLRRSPL
jgi:uncharacterized repeat protein (TIGR03803 family)